MKLDDLIDKLVEIRKVRGGKLDVLVYDSDYSEYCAVRSVEAPVELEECIEVPKDVKRHKVVFINY